MGDRKVHACDAPSGDDSCGCTMKFDPWGGPDLSPNLDIVPAYAGLAARAEGLDGGLLGREASGVVGEARAVGVAVGAFVGREDSLQERISAAREDLFESIDLRDVDA